MPRPALRPRLVTVKKCIKRDLSLLTPAWILSQKVSFENFESCNHTWLYCQSSASAILGFLFTFTGSPILAALSTSLSRKRRGAGLLLEKVKVSHWLWVAQPHYSWLHLNLFPSIASQVRLNKTLPDSLFSGFDWKFVIVWKNTCQVLKHENHIWIFDLTFSRMNLTIIKEFTFLIWKSFS